MIRTRPSEDRRFRFFPWAGLEQVLERGEGVDAIVAGDADDLHGAQIDDYEGVVDPVEVLLDGRVRVERPGVGCFVGGDPTIEIHSISHRLVAASSIDENPEQQTALGDDVLCLRGHRTGHVDAVASGEAGELEEHVLRARLTSHVHRHDAEGLVARLAGDLHRGPVAAEREVGEHGANLIAVGSRGVGAAEIRRRREINPGRKVSRRREIGGTTEIGEQREEAAR